MRKEFNNIKDMACPSDDFVKNLWSRLDAEFKDVVVVGQSYTRRYVYMFGMVFVVVTTMGTGTYAYASDAVTPDSTLYGVKTGIESVESMFYRSQDSMSNFHVRMANRRNTELDHAVSEEAREILETRLTLLLRTAEGDLVKSDQTIEYRQITANKLSMIHDQRFREEADAKHDELLKRLDALEETGEIPHEKAVVFRTDMQNPSNRRIYMIQVNSFRLEDMRSPQAR